jgi:hypothetical protein
MSGGVAVIDFGLFLGGDRTARAVFDLPHGEKMGAAA